MEPITRFESKTVVLPVDNVDTDQIVPARFLTVTTRDGMGAHLFADWRTDPAFVLNQPEAVGASILGNLRGGGYVLAQQEPSIAR